MKIGKEFRENVEFPTSNRACKTLHFQLESISETLENRTKSQLDPEEFSMNFPRVVAI